MRSGPRIKVGARLTIAVFTAVMLSWIISSGIASYVAYQRFLSLRQQMLARPDIYPNPIPEPHFGVLDFIIGPRPGPPHDREEHRRPNDAHMPPATGTNMQPMPGLPPEAMLKFDEVSPWRILAVRMLIALLIAVVTGWWLSVHFTRRLQELANGAQAFDEGDFAYRVPKRGDDEFAHVAAAMNSMAETVSGQINRLEDDAKRRRQFLADVAHELRGPVATIRTMSGALEDGIADDPERRARASSSLVRSSDRLLRITTDLLDLAKLDLRELSIYPRRADLRELARHTFDYYTASAASAGVTLCPIENGDPIIAKVDPDRLAQVLDNLVTNAISYAGEGAEVRISIEEGDPMRITITDTGHGIPPEHLQYIFEPFYRADPARTPSSEHSGLGLRISRGLVEAHGGTLNIFSDEWHGTTAIIEIPMGEVQAER